jgi:hypothetical protein
MDRVADWTRFNYINYIIFWEGNSVTWRDTYKAIFRCEVIANVPKIEFNNEEDKEYYRTKFLRHYTIIMLLYFLWENIPIVLNPSNDRPEQKSIASLNFK